MEAKIKAGALGLPHEPGKPKAQPGQPISGPGFGPILWPSNGLWALGQSPVGFSGGPLGARQWVLSWVGLAAGMSGPGGPKPAHCGSRGVLRRLVSCLEALILRIFVAALSCP